MLKIYLASQSKARAELLKKVGFKFKVIIPKIKEDDSCSLSYPSLVKKNALAKAEDVARKIKEGIIIAADTICVQDRKIFGKPKDLKDAQRMLKRLSLKPNWVYSGLAVMRKEGKIKKALVDYEKTKVVMDRLSDKEIKSYFKKVSVLDKAGSFDIQGRGAFFIRGIEGCFYNVVGLPLRKLFLMLKKIGIKNFIFLFFFILSGCSYEYNIVTGKEEAYYYSTDREIQLGKNIAQEVEKQYKKDVDPLMQKRVEEIGKKIVAVCDRKELDYSFTVLDDDDVNAFALPGGFIYVNRGLIEKVSNDDELACVLAHEVGHIVARHSIKKLQAVQSYSLLRLLTVAVPSSYEIALAADSAFTQILLGYSREDELLADQLGARYAKLAGYDPSAMISFLKKLEEINKRKPLGPKSYYKTHPYVPDRVRVVKQELGQKIDFDDYINIEQLPRRSY